MELQISIGQVNFTNYLHITVAKATAPTVIVHEVWLATPFTSYNYTVNNLDNAIYLITYYDAPTASTLGLIQLQLQVNALTNELLSERRFYTCGTDMADGASTVVDSYLIGQKVASVFKEGARFLKPVTEWAFDAITGTVSVINGTTFSTGEVFSVEIFYNSSTTITPVSNGLYTDTITVTALSSTLTIADINKRVRLVNNNIGGVKQTIIMPALATINEGQGFYFDRVDGFEKSQAEFIFDGSDLLLYKGFGGNYNLFPIFWIGMSEQILIRKSGIYWELILPYVGVDVGQRVIIASSSGQAVNYVQEDGSLYSEQQLPRLMYWIIRILGLSNYVVDDTIVNVGWVHPTGTENKFYINSAKTYLRVPNTNVYFRKI